MTSSEAAAIIGPGPRRVARALAEALESTLGEAADQTTKTVRNDLRELPKEMERSLHRALENQLEPFKASIFALRERLDAVEEHVTSVIARRIDEAQTSLDKRVHQSRVELGTDVKSSVQDLAKSGALETMRDGLTKEIARRGAAVESVVSDRLAATTHHIGRIAEHLAEIRAALEGSAEIEAAVLELRAPIDRVAEYLEMLANLSARLDAFEPAVEALAPQINAAPVALKAVDARIAAIEEAHHQLVEGVASLRRQSMWTLGLVAALATAALATAFSPLIAP
ncbi:MAG: hypothetical protein H6729_00380 [Deltaproteobacteria bacterium]|nr:hypothetical protein [Deltaproteobacteria bacterium]